MCRITMNPNQTTDRVRYTWQAIAHGKRRYASQDLVCPTDALRTWYTKYNQELTETSSEYFFKYIYSVVLTDKPGAPITAREPDYKRAYIPTHVESPAAEAIPNRSTAKAARNLGRSPPG